MGAPTAARVDVRWVLARPARVPLTLASRFTLAMALILMNVADVVTTRMLLDAGGRETNPIANHLLEGGVLTEVKIGLAGIVGVLMLVAPCRRRAEQTLWFVATAYAMVLGLHLVQLYLTTF